MNKSILTIKRFVSAKKILFLGVMLVFILSSVTAFAYEYSDAEYNSAKMINENEVVEFTFNSVDDIIKYKFNVPYDYASIVVEFLDGNGDGIQKEYVSYRIRGNQQSEIYTQSSDTSIFSGNLKVNKNDKTYVKFSIANKANTSILNQKIRFRYVATSYNIGGWQSAASLNENTASTLSFNSMTSDKWFRIQINSDKLELRYEMPKGLSGCFISDIYSEEDLKNNNVAEYSYSIVPMQSERLAISGAIEPGIYYIHLYPTNLYEDVLNQNITFSYLDTGEIIQTEEPKPASDAVVTSFGAITSSWAAPEIELAFENDLIPEVMINYDLTKQVNRGEFAAIALQLYDVLTNSETAVPSSCPFTDINGDINEMAIKKASSLDITNGISETTFEPVSFITREQLATMLCRVIKKYGFKDWTLATDSDYYLNTDGAKIFADDADISDWARPSVYYMSLHGIVNGIDETHFAPKNTTTQQEAAGYATATREQAIILAQRIFTKSDMLGN